MTRFELVTIQTLHDAWETVKDGVAVCIRSDDENPTPEDVYAAIKAGKAGLHLVYEDERYIGFTVLIPFTGPYNGESQLHIWLVYSPFEGKNIFSLGYGEAMRIAKSIGAKRITFRSPRKGFERLVKPFGFEVSEIQFEKRL